MKLGKLLLILFLLTSIRIYSQEFKRDLREANGILIVKISHKDSLIDKWFNFKLDLLDTIKGNLKQRNVKVGYFKPYSRVCLDKQYYLIKKNDSDTSLQYMFYDFDNYRLIYRYINDSSYRKSVGQDSNSLLNDNESDYLASRFNGNSFDFTGKRICFFFDSQILSKRDYFNQLGEDFSFDQLLIFDNSDKEQIDYDAAIISWHKFDVKTEKDKYIKRIKKYTAHNKGS